MKTATQNFTLLLALALSALTGCSVLNTAGESAFSCPGLPQGVTCKTPSAVFSSTNGALPTTDSDLPMRGTAAYTAMINQSRETAPMPKGSVIGINDGAYNQGDVKTPLPVRSSARVMRIWIAPWVDKNDDLHLPSFLYTEVQSRKWNLGESEFIGNGVTVPYRVIEQAAGQTNSVPLPKSDAASMARAGKAGLAVGQAPSVAAGASDAPEDMNLGE